MTGPTPQYFVQRAHVPWRELKLEIFLISAGVLIVLFSLALDIRAYHADWFPRSGAVVAFVSAILAYRSLGKHYDKFINAHYRGSPLATSPNQWKVDIITLVLSVVGTLIWAYGDKLLQLLRLADA